MLVPFTQGDTSSGSIELDYAVLQYRFQVFNIYAVAIERSQVKRLALDGGDAFSREMSYSYDEHILRIVVGKTSYLVSSGLQPARELSEESDAGVHSSNRLELDLSGREIQILV